jgi:RNA polymerase sigma factor (sigma-70 family)
MSSPDQLERLDTVELVTLARARDRDAWHELVRRYAPLVWRVAQSFRLDHADAKDVSQNTWFALAERLGGLREPARLAAWLTTVARREALRMRELRRREVRPDWWPEGVEVVTTDRCPEACALRTVRDQLLWRAFAALPENCRRLLGLVAHAPELSYGQVAQLLGMKSSAVGSSRNRCLHALRRKLSALGLGEGATG